MVYMGDGATSKAIFMKDQFRRRLFRAGGFLVRITSGRSQFSEKTDGSQNLAQKAITYGFQGLQVDGNDVFAVYRATNEALTRAREGKGPTLIECVTYRLGDHTTADDASRYRSREEVEQWKKKDPIERLRMYMEKTGLWNKTYDQEVRSQAKDKVEEAVRETENMSPPDPRDMFHFMFHELTAELRGADGRISRRKRKTNLRARLLWQRSQW
jgi:pyruvate dehydrogenase E1 component alpha subunit